MDRVVKIARSMTGPKAKLLHYFLRVVYACDIMPGTKIGPNTVFPHAGLGVVIHPDAVIGDNCRIYQNVTIGGRGSAGAPKIEDGVVIGAGALVLGDITVGEDAIIGAGSVVLADVPNGATVVGNPARVIKAR